MGAVVTCRGAGSTPDGLLNQLAAAGFEVGDPTPSATTVLDTFDGRLHAEGLRLERGGTMLALRGPGASVASTPTERAPRFAADLPPGPLRDRLLDVIEIRALLAQATVCSTVRRAERRNAERKVVAAVRIHERISADDVALDGWLIEVAPLTGYERQAADALDTVAPHAGPPLEGDAITVALDIAGVELGGRTVEPGIALDPTLPAVEGFRLVLANLAEAITINLPGTVDDIDPEFLHDLRVAVRRSRSVMRHGRAVLPADVVTWAEPALRSLGTLTGPPRDLDVQVTEWDDTAASLGPEQIVALAPVRAQLVAERDVVHEQLAIALASAEVQDLLDRWSAIVATPISPSDAGPRGADPIADVARRRIVKAQRRMLRHGRAVTPDTPAEDVHRVRKDAKQLRYLLECFAGVLPAEGRKAFVKRLKKLQDVLGEHQDAEVQEASLRLLAEQLPSTSEAATYLAVGQLVEQLDRRRRTTRDAFADRFAEFDSKPTRQTFDEMLDGDGS
jgi:CHAD domain-containing protein